MFAPKTLFPLFLMLSVILGTALAGSHFLSKPAVITQTNESLRNGLWTDATMWSRNSVPESTDDVFVRANHRVTVDIVATTVNSLQVEATGVIDVQRLLNITSTTSIGIIGGVNGLDGAPTQSGGIVMLTADQDINISGSVRAGHAGRATRTIVRAVDSSEAVANGQAGAWGGECHIISNNGGIYVSAGACIRSGNGADGGYAEAVGWDATVDGQNGGDARAYAGTGGSAGTLMLSAQSGSGLIVLPNQTGVLVAGNAGRGGDAVTHTGNGGAGSALTLPGVGGASEAIGGNGGNSFVVLQGLGIPSQGTPEYVSFLSTYVAPSGGAAGPGGSALGTMGAVGSVASGVVLPANPGTAGKTDRKIGGNGGCSLFVGLPDGGSATATGGEGSAGCPGGIGGWAFAQGGEGGLAGVTAGDGGEAVATGGMGGPGYGVCCPTEQFPSCPGCQGGTGGEATAKGGRGYYGGANICYSVVGTAITPPFGGDGGDATSTGGNGGRGGHGRPPGWGGSGGLALGYAGAGGAGYISNGVEGTTTKTNGSVGPPGSPCPGPGVPH